MARTCANQIIDLFISLLNLRVPLLTAGSILRDWKSVIVIYATLRANIHKKHVAPSCYVTRDDVASKIASCYLINGVHSPAWILSKRWALHNAWLMVKLLLF